MTRRWLLVAAVAAGLAGCAHDVHARFPHPPDGSQTATLVLRFTSAVDHAHVSVNGVPVASGVRTSKITVEDVPAGECAVMMAANGIPEKAFVLNLQPGQRAVVPLSSPGVSYTKTVFQTLAAAAVYAAYLVISHAI